MSISTSTDALARTGHALSDPTRTRVLLRLPEGPACPVELTDPRLSRALRDLLDLVLVVDPDCLGGAAGPDLATAAPSLPARTEAPA